MKRWKGDREDSLRDKRVDDGGMKGWMMEGWKDDAVYFKSVRQR